VSKFQTQKSGISMSSKKSAKMKDDLVSIRLDITLVAEENGDDQCGDSPCSEGLIAAESQSSS
jgi:hypothetical protein